MAEQLETIEPSPATPADPPIITQEAFTAYQDSMDKKFEALGAQIAAGNAPPPPATPPPVVVDHTKELADIDSALVTLGEQIDTATQEQQPIGTLLAQRDGLNMQRMEITTIAPLRNAGLNAIAKLSATQAFAGEGIDQVLYKKYQPEIDALLETVAPGQRLDAGVAKQAYFTVIGQHSVDIVNAGVEASIRAKKDGGGDPTAPNATRIEPGTGSAAVPTVLEFLGADAVKALDAVHMTGDEYARRRKYKNWEEWVAGAKEMGYG